MHVADLQACFKGCRPNITKATARPTEETAQTFSRRQALLLGAGSLAASTFASPLTAIADTPDVAALGIKSAETVQLGQSGMYQENEWRLLHWTSTYCQATCQQACRSVQ